MTVLPVVAADDKLFRGVDQPAFKSLVFHPAFRGMARTVRRRNALRQHFIRFRRRDQRGARAFGSGISNQPGL